MEYLSAISPNPRFEKLFKAMVLDIWKNNYLTLDNENDKIRKEIAALEQERQKVFDFHRNGTYSDADFEQQKNYINRRINEKRLLINEKAAEEYKMEEALDYCFNFIRDSAKTWKDFETNHGIRVRFQKRIFTGPLEFNGKIFSGTPSLSCVYKINEHFQNDETSLVAPRRIGLRFTA